ncbi:hypothetical protein SBC2_01450 [Caballeronia sp. SBC2]|nr:hypothetical protein SBC2_01450 [Caballeronia sp. SBC2]
MLPVQAIFNLCQFIRNVNRCLEPISRQRYQALPDETPETVRNVLFERIPVRKALISHSELESVPIKRRRCSTKPRELLLEGYVAAAHAIEGEAELVDIKCAIEV